MGSDLVPVTAHFERREAFLTVKADIVREIGPNEARSRVGVERARSLWPVTVVAAAVVAISTGVLLVLPDWRVVVGLALFISPVSVATVWKVLGKTAPGLP